MKKICIAAMMFFLLAPMIAWAQSESSATINHQQGNFSYSEGGPSAPPGTIGNFIYIPSHIPAPGEFMTYFNNALNWETKERLYHLSRNVKNKLDEKITIETLPNAPDRVEMLTSIPDDKRLLGYYESKTKNDQNLLLLAAMLMAEAKILTNCSHVHIEVYTKLRPEAMGFAIGSSGVTQTTKSVGDDASMSVGALIGWARAENFLVSLVRVSAFGGEKNIPVTEEKTRSSAPATNAQPSSYPAPPALPTELSVAGPITEAVYFDFDIDVPQSGQDEKIEQIVRWMGTDNNFMKIDELIFRGYCDVRGKESYNSDLGLRRAKAVMYAVVARIYQAIKPEEKAQFDQLWQKKFRATSASDLMPDFPDDQKNRRVELFLNAQRLTTVQ